MKNICGKIPVELHEKVRAEIEERETSTQIFIRQVIEEHFNRLENKGEESMEKRTLAVQVTEQAVWEKNHAACFFYSAKEVDSRNHSIF